MMLVQNICEVNVSSTLDKVSAHCDCHASWLDQPTFGSTAPYTLIFQRGMYSCYSDYVRKAVWRLLTLVGSSWDVVAGDQTGVWTSYL